MNVFWPQENPLSKEAEVLFKKAYAYQSQGLLDLAIEHYMKSIELFPTAEAHTFLGWALSFQGKLHEAIEQCKIAIQIDPDFGNPYNDIGSYLIALGKPEEAIAWLKKAIEAKRYEPRHFPHINLARVYIMKNMTPDAIMELETALRICPDDSAAKKELSRLVINLN